MRRPQVIVIALAFVLFADESIGQETVLPKSAKLTRDSHGHVTAVRITGESNLDRLAVAPEGSNRDDFRRGPVSCRHAGSRAGRPIRSEGTSARAIRVFHFQWNRLPGDGAPHFTV